MRIASDIFRFCAIIIGLGLIFAWLGVYNTGQLPFFERFAFWTATMAVGGGASAFIAPFAWSERFAHVAAIFKIGAVATIVSVPVTILLVFVLNRSPWRLDYFMMQFGYVLVISLIITTLAFVANALQEKTEDETPKANPVSSFLERLPVKYRTADLYAISSEDHYLRIHTSLGEELILMRLADAVRELTGAEGLQVHRSWWVAKQGIQDEKRIDGRSLLVLPSGTEVPVSRSYRTKAKDAGLIR